ncbi:MAG: hypothetical protein MJ082_00060 [Clostridia bacterium]|nr:hypothetical protein [Clostridia bacterium]
MKATFDNGDILLSGRYFEKSVYHVSNDCMSAVFDGLGAVPSVALGGKQAEDTEAYLVLTLNGCPWDVLSPKTVRMAGRKQTFETTDGGRTVAVTLFLDKHLPGYFLTAQFTSQSPADVLEIGICDRSHLFGTEDRDVVPYQIKPVSAAVSAPSRYVPENGMLSASLAPGGKVGFFMGFDVSPETARDAAEKYETYLADCDAEIRAVVFPEGLSETEKAMYRSAWFCAYENYKEAGDYRGFMAGHRYLYPMRTYYRDSYFTVLPLYPSHPELIRAQVLTLARGIGEDGNCPSAVRADYSAHWGNHFDSPSFLVMMAHDYVKYTGDRALLSEKLPGGRTLHETLTAALCTLRTHADDTGLLFKAGKYNKRDWADEVNREGYVTYDEILYARAHDCMAYLSDLVGDGKGDFYRAEAKKIKKAINDLLFDESLGYYVNCKSAESVQDNLSIDTVFAVLFGIAQGERARTLLEKMEKILEVRNHPEWDMPDFGTMCVYPFYKGHDSATNKSSQPFYYHNGANWPHLTSMYALAKRKHGMEWRGVLENFFTYGIGHGNYTPVEFYSAPRPDGSLLQAWCADAAFVLDEKLSDTFFG